jgi:1,4-alpha-glucan branching enzyme
MPASQQYITPDTPMGATLVQGGATFRTWAREAQQVYIAVQPHANPYPKPDADLLVSDGQGHWTGFIPNLADGALYRFYVVGNAGEGFKRDPYARELEFNGYPDCDCILRNVNDYPWHDQGFRPPKAQDLIVYQFHVGAFYAKGAGGNDIRPNRVSKILDVLDRIEYLADLGVNAVMPLPFQEFQGANGLGYNGTDLFSPEMDYAVQTADLAAYLGRVNRLLAAKGATNLTNAQLRGQINQFKAFIDLCHLYGIAVIADVVYNHAGGNFDPQSIYFYDFQNRITNANSLFFTADGHAGGLVFDYSKAEVRQFLIDNAKSLIQEYHIDGLRYDQVTVIDEHRGWFFCQDLTSTLRFIKNDLVQIAEYWPWNRGDRWRGIANPPSGMGFDVGYSDVLRDGVRKAISDASRGGSAQVDMDVVREALYFTYNDPNRSTVFQCIENHDLVDDTHVGNDKKPRIALLADPSNARSDYARKRAKIATGLLLTAPGVPMIFMGQEFLEYRYWTDWVFNPHIRELLIDWAGLEGRDKHMSDHHRFTRDLMWLRRRQPALRDNGLNVFHTHNDNRVIAFHRWVPGNGRDVVIVASLNETTFRDRSYRIGLPSGGHWQEVFNSDVYDNWFNPTAMGNYGGVAAEAIPWDGMPASGAITLPANSLLVFARDQGG